MNNIEIYCDESCLEALSDKDAHKFMAIGGIWIPAEYRATFKEEVKQIKDRFKMGGEIKWRKISPATLPFYKALIDYFFTSDSIRFRVIIVEAQKVNNDLHNNADAELGFYKFYYQLIKHWLFYQHTYTIFADYKVNGDPDRLKSLKRYLEYASLGSNIEQIQALHSNESTGIQFADLLTGAVTAKFNDNTQSEAKKEVIKLIESHLHHTIRATGKNENKFCVFNINLQNNW